MAISVHTNTAALVALWLPLRGFGARLSLLDGSGVEITSRD